ncbi:MAG TPA: ankyrin repeat domain-containing protein [Candidatus Baltobacteraceae bacterium]|nr:ankyrin repeat domain-containing protein [Candidatus Baltobacteraceae bacterium]
MRRLLAQGVDPNAHGSDGISALEWAAAKGRVDEVLVLLGAHAAVDAAYNPEKYTPLMRAANFGFPQVVKVLVAHGARVNAHNAYGQTALDFALYTNHTAIAAILKRDGAISVGHFYPREFCNAGTKAGLTSSAWGSASDAPAMYFCQAVKHDFGSGSGDVVMYTYEVDGTIAFAKSIYIKTDVFMTEIPTQMIAQTLTPLIRQIYANAHQGQVPSDLLDSLVAFKNVRQDTPLGLVTGVYAVGDHPDYPTIGAEYTIRITLH